MCACVRVCLYMYVSVSTHVGMYTCMGRPQANYSVLYFGGESFSLTLELASLARLASQQAPGIPLFVPPHLGVKGVL